MKIIVNIVFCILVISCSNLSKNIVKKGDFYINNGRSNNLEWSEDLKLNRLSWYNEMTLLFDTMYGEIETGNKFNNWFSDEEKKRLSKCSRKLLTVNYSLDERISHQMFENKLRSYGYEKVPALNFEKSLRSHPDYSQHLMSLYKVNIFCSYNNSRSVLISFPNFNEVELK